jgi:indole-3-glycerol phosphate synthase
LFSLSGSLGFAPELRDVMSRRFSQAISEGDGISVVVPVDGPGSARAAEEQGAEALALHEAVHQVREATTLPLLWRPHGSPELARAAEADACVLTFAELDDEDGQLEEAYREALEMGLECALEVRDEEELEAVLERLDPELFLLAAGDGGDEGPLQRVLDLLQDVPAGKLAIAELAVRGRDDVAELERAGMDAVIVPAGDVAELVGGSAPEV